MANWVNQRLRVEKGRNHKNQTAAEISMTDDTVIDLITLSPTEIKPSSLPPPPAEKLKCFLALGLTLFGTTFASALIILNNDRVPINEPPLPDIFFDFFPRVPFAFKLAECILLHLLLVMLTIAFLHQHRWILFRRIFANLGILYTLRGIFLYVTSLPNPYPEKECAPPAESMLEAWTRVFSLVSRLGLHVAGQNYCGDLIFSGHSVSIIGLYLYILEYTPPNLRLLRVSSFVLSSTGLVLVLMSREHYTIDVIIAYYLVTRIHWTYHTIANFPSLQKTSSKYNLLTRSLLHPIVVFFERNVGGPVPNEFVSLRSVSAALTSMYKSACLNFIRS